MIPQAFQQYVSIMYQYVSYINIYLNLIWFCHPCHPPPSPHRPHLSTHLSPSPPLLSSPSLVTPWRPLHPTPPRSHGDFRSDRGEQLLLSELPGAGERLGDLPRDRVLHLCAFDAITDISPPRGWANGITGRKWERGMMTSGTTARGLRRT